MPRVCEVTGKRRMSGNNVSHANNKTKRRYLPNIQKKRFWVESKDKVPGEGKFITLKVSTQAMRLIDKLGIEVVLERIQQKLKLLKGSK